MFEVTVENSFAAAHRLREYKGNCERLHGHNWRVKMTFHTDSLNTLGLAIDFRIARKILADVLSVLDHTNLNELDAFTRLNPSAERIAEYIFTRATGVIANYPGIENVAVRSVTVFETPGSAVTFYPG